MEQAAQQTTQSHQQPGELKAGIFDKLKSFALQSKRVWHILKKPSSEEFKAVAKVSALGILAIGAIGFILSDAIRILIKLF